jgi:PKD repeat protein
LGTTSSTNFPTSASAFDRTYNGGVPENNVIPYNNGSDIFVARVSKNGNQLLACSYFGGTQNDGLNPTISPLVRNYGDQLRGDIISDANGNIFISTVTSSTNFPVSNSFALGYKGGDTDAVLLKLSNDLSQVVWGAFLGGSDVDASHTIQIDKDGNLFVGGGSLSSNFPTTTGSYQPVLAGNVDGWIAKIKGDGSAILNSTFTGTSGFNQVYFIDLDKDENVYAYGQTEGSFPITQGKYNNPNSGQFLQKFNNSLSTLEFSTVFGSGIGIPNISPTAFLVNDCNNIYMAGWGGFLNTATGFWNSNTRNMAITSDAIQTSTSGNDFYFLVLSSDATKLLYATYLGGANSLTHVDGGTSRFDKGGIVYHAVCSGCAFSNSSGSASSDFPTTSNAYSRVNRSGNCNNAAFKFDLSTLKARIQTNSVKLNQPGLTKVCFPDPIVFQNRSIGGQQFFWSFGDGNKQTKTDTAAITYKYKSIGTYPVKLKVTDAGTCLGKDSTTVQIQVVPVQGFAGADQVICSNTGTQLTAGGGVNYQWKNKLNSFNSGQPSPFISPTESDTYFVTITDSNGCMKKDTVNVRVVPGIDLKFSAERVNFDCFNLPSLKVVSDVDPKEDVFFDFGDGTTSDMPNVIHQYSKGGNYTVRLVGKKESCVYEKKIDVTIDSLRIPNVITPGVVDSFNDTFKIQYGNTQTQQGIKISVSIYNRWGGLVYESKDYKDDWSGNEVTAGVYFYEVTVEGITSCRSWLQVIK